MFKPSLLAELNTYGPRRLAADATAGAVVGVVALPLAIAFAISSGVSPEKGLITAVIGGFLISALGGSRYQIGGPTGAFIVIVSGVVAQYGLQGLITATLMAGVILIAMGLARFGAILKFIPYPVTVGFTTGIALIIFSTQIDALLGLGLESVPSRFLTQWKVYFRSFGAADPVSMAVSGAAVLILSLWPRVTHRIPGTVIALVVCTVLVKLFDLPVETIGTRFGEIPRGLPVPVVPALDPDIIRALIKPATTIAILAAIESLLSAVVADGMTGSRHDSDTELVAQGIGNVAVAVFGGIPATGAIARTATNIRNGATSPVAGMVHAVTLLLIMVFFAPFAALIPMPVLAAILVKVAYNMSEVRSFATLLRAPRSDVLVLLTTFGMTIVFDLTIAIEVGMILAAFLFMRRMAEVSNVEVVGREYGRVRGDAQDPLSIGTRTIPEGVQVYEINGSFFFGAATKFKESMRFLDKPPRVQILRMRNVFALDATGLHLLEDLILGARKRGTTTLISGIHTQPTGALRRYGLLEELGAENICEDIDDALARARTLLETENRIS